MQNWRDSKAYFYNIPTGFLSALWESAEFPWSPLVSLKFSLNQFFLDKISTGDLPGTRHLVKQPDGSLREGGWFLLESVILAEDFIDCELRIFISQGTFVEAGATIKNHSVFETNCEIRQGAYVRGNVYIGQGSVVGHVTEIKNCIFHRHVEAGHFAYIGDSILGSYVNLGAGTKISNLQFRNYEQKKDNQFPEIPFSVGGNPVSTGLYKFGAVIGDGCEIGCNAVLSPLVLLEPECWVLPNLTVPKGIYPKGKILKTFLDCKSAKI